MSDRGANSVIDASPERGESPSLRRIGPTARIWLLTLLLAGGAAAVAVLMVAPLPPIQAPVRVPWWVVAIGFAVTESFVVHLQIRREAHSFSLSDLPLVLGLIFTTPLGVIAAQVVGAAVALAIRRQSPMKFAFNIGQFAFTAALAVVVFHAIGHANPIGWQGLVGVLLATGTTTVVGAMAITAAISLHEGRAQLQTLQQGIGFGMVVAVTDTCLALIGAEIMWRDPASVWLLAIPAVLLFAAYRLYTGQRQKHETMEVLYEASQSLRGSLRIEDTIRTLLTEARHMFRAELAVITLFPSGPGTRAVRTTLGPGNGEMTETLDLDPTEGVWARVAAEGQALLLAKPMDNEKLRRHFAARGIHDAMVAPLRADGRVVGTLLVGNRLSEVSSFDREDLRLFETLANQADAALENARLVARLEESLAHLTEMNRLKDDFVATVSHELRTPLTNIQGSIKTLLRLDLPEADRRDLLDAADRGSDRLRQLIEDLLIASRIESREVRPVVSRVEIDRLLRTIAAEVGVENDGRRLVLQIDSDLPVVETDEGKLAQIVSNLLDNARKYSFPDSTVRLDATPSEDGVLISIVDRGDPIPAAEQEKIWERFFQVDQTSTRSFGGAGLGLYICRQLAEAIGGRVWLDHSDEEETAFSLFVPRTAPASALRPEDPVTAPR